MPPPLLFLFSSRLVIVGLHGVPGRVAQRFFVGVLLLLALLPCAHEQ